MSNTIENDRVKEVIVDSRISKVLNLRTDSIIMIESLEAISDFYVSNTQDARKSLRNRLENQNIEYGKKFIIELEAIKNRIENLEYFSHDLHSSCLKLATKVEDADNNMKNFIEKASQLEARKSQYLLQSTEVSNFLSKYHMSSSEIEALHSTNLDSTQEAKNFFLIFQRLLNAYRDCRTMTEKEFYGVGFELLEVLGQHRDAVYLHLFEWVKSKCQSIAETGSIDDNLINNRIQVSIGYLKNVSVYYIQCQDLLINARRSLLVQKFINALTIGDSSNGKTVTALDLQSHDAVAYVGGMLAWVHQALAIEREFLDSTFSTPASQTIENIGKDVDFDTHEDSTESFLSLNDILSRITQGLGRPLKVRISQTIESCSTIEILYSLTDLLSFYESTFFKVVSSENSIHTTVKTCFTECKSIFFNYLKKQADSLKSSPVTYSSDLKSSIVTRECAKQINGILKVCSFALSPICVEESNELYVDTILGDIIQPLLQSCRLGGNNLKSTEMAVYMLNNISYLQHEIVEALKDSKNKSTIWKTLLVTETETWVDVLVQAEVSHIFQRSEIDKLVEIIDILPKGLKASEQFGLDKDKIETVMRAFYSSLYSTITSHFEKLQDPSLREQIRKKVAGKISEAHAKVYNLVSNKNNGYDPSILSHSIEEINVLLGYS